MVLLTAATNLSAVNGSVRYDAAELQKIYESEINVSISWLWDGGIEVRLGDQVNGFVAEETFALVAGIGSWVQQAIAHDRPFLPFEYVPPAKI
jgi:hypothetical protein